MPAYLGLFSPLGRVSHLLLDLVNAFERVHALVQQEGGVVHQHVDELHELLSGSEMKWDRESN
jgi:hypothetical protein